MQTNSVRNKEGFHFLFTLSVIYKTGNENELFSTIFIPTKFNMKVSLYLSIDLLNILLIFFISHHSASQCFKGLVGIMHTYSLILHNMVN